MASHSPRAMKRRTSKACGKTRYPDERAAKSALRTITAAGSVDPDGKIPVRWYHCDRLEGGCGGVHLTSQE